MAEATDGSNKSGWVHWLGRIVIWLVGAAAGAVLGVLLVNAIGPRERVLLSLIGVAGLTGMIGGVFATRLPSFCRDLMVGIGSGIVGISGCAIHLGSVLPSC